MGRRAEQSFFQIWHPDGQQACEKMFNAANYQRNGNKNQWDITSHLSEWLSSKSLEITNVGEKKEPLYTINMNGNWCSHYGK